ncbi:hypothetical protein [Sphingomonas sp.]|uniref:hypothetical protein n=1 Tax=Sphingomonas sp. TaxID=28214 RepID=UPI0035C80465
MTMHTTRRALVGGVGLAAVALVGPAAASKLPKASSIEGHWQTRCAAYREFEADATVLDDNERANDYWDRIDATEIAILDSPDTSIRAAELRLWIAWSHCDDRNREGVAQGDVQALRRVHSSLDWHEKLIFAAILNLRGEG